MSGIELLIIGSVAANTVYSIGHNSGFFSWVGRKWRLLFKSRCVSISYHGNPEIVYYILKALNSIKDQKCSVMVTVNINGKSEVFCIPEFGTEIYVTTKYGTLYIKSISLDGYNLTAFELSSSSADSDIIDIFMNNIISLHKHMFSDSTIKYYHKLATNLIEEKNNVKSLVTKNDVFDEIFTETKSLDIESKHELIHKSKDDVKEETKNDNKCSKSEILDNNIDQFVALATIMKTQTDQLLPLTDHSDNVNIDPSLM